MNIEQAVDLAIDNTITDGLTDIFGDCLEVGLLKDQETKQIIRKEIITIISKKQFNQLEPQPIQYILIPKSHQAYDYRRGALMHLCCHLKYMTLCILIAEEIEKSRIPVSEKRCFSNRFQVNNGKIFSNKESYTEWLEDYIEKKKSKKYKIIVQCDIASFFDRVNIHRIDSTLQDIGIDEWKIKTLIGLLEFWAKKDSYGIPIGSNGSRILAEASLIDIDNYLLSEKIDFTRYVDDFRLFAPDISTAQKWVIKLLTRLFREGLLLNAGKTRFIDCTKEEVEEEKEQDKAEQVVKIVTRLGGKYNRIPRVFRMPSKEKYEVFYSVDIKKEIEEINQTPMVSFEKIQKVIIASIIKQEWNTLLLCPTYIRDYTYGINYIVDMLIKNKNAIPERVKREISIEMGKFISEKTFENIDWYEFTLIKLLSLEDYYNKAVLLKYFLESSKFRSTLPSMAALEGLMKEATRTDVKSIRDNYDKCDHWEQRRIISLVSEKLPTEEKKAWLRYIQPLVNDMLTKIYFDKALKA